LKEGCFQEAKTQFENALVASKEAKAPPATTASIMFHLAQVHQQEGRHEASVDLLEQALAIRKECLGPRNMDTAVTAMRYYYSPASFTHPYAAVSHPFHAPRDRNTAFNDGSSDGGQLRCIFF
jgi:hypothetical protein